MVERVDLSELTFVFDVWCFRLMLVRFHRVHRGEVVVTTRGTNGNTRNIQNHHIAITLPIAKDMVHRTTIRKVIRTVDINKNEEWRALDRVQGVRGEIDRDHDHGRDLEKGMEIITNQKLIVRNTTNQKLRPLKK